ARGPHEVARRGRQGVHPAARRPAAAGQCDELSAAADDFSATRSRLSAKPRPAPLRLPMPMISDVFIRTAAGLAVAFGLGALIGLERQYRQRTAGLRTNVLVAVGAAAFADLRG